jgi:hypothetical protein
MGFAKDMIACLTNCAFRLKIKCKGKCCESDCLIEEGDSAHVHPSPVLSVKNMPIHEEKASAHISTL